MHNLGFQGFIVLTNESLHKRTQITIRWFEFFLFGLREGNFRPSMTFGEGNGRARRKQLSVVFTEAMSRVASRTSRVSQAKGDDTKADGVA